MISQFLLIGAGLLALATHPDNGRCYIHRYSSPAANAFSGSGKDKAEQEMGALKQMTVSRCVVCRMAWRWR